jgi:CyaY protein
MTEMSFSVRAAQDLEQLITDLEAIDALEDVDIDLIDGVLTLGFEDGSQVIVNRQEPLQQLWLASPQGPAHFSLSEDREDWIDERTGATLYATLSSVLSQKMGQDVRFD